MTENFPTAAFAPESLNVADKTPFNAVLRDSSRKLGWKSVLLDSFEATGECEEYGNTWSHDVKIVVGLSGAWDLWELNNGRWDSAVLHTGSVNVIGAGEKPKLRWRNRNPTPFRVANAFISPAFLEAAADFYSRPGQRLEHRIPSSIILNDPVIAATITAMVEASNRGAGELYAEQASRWLATHLVHAHGRAYAPSEDPRNIGTISDVRLSRVIEYMRENLARQMTITELANVAAVSPFHFCRLFTSVVGKSPHRYLVDRRMQKGEALLRTTTIPLAEIASLCGYARTNAFSSAFQRQFGVTPTSHRRDCRS